jgi:hypothetical protein
MSGRECVSTASGRSPMWKSSCLDRRDREHWDDLVCGDDATPDADWKLDKSGGAGSGSQSWMGLALKLFA